jgi:biopolymer transport protein ExbD
MRIGSPLPHKKARIEIIPLIDIMFFLLAAFMLASLSMMRLQSIAMNLPTATVARRDTKPDMVNVAVDQSGNITIDKQPYSQPELRKLLTERVKTNSHLPVYISGNENATHGTLIDVLDLVKSTGIQNVSFALASTPGGQKK